MEIITSDQHWQYTKYAPGAVPAGTAHGSAVIRLVGLSVVLVAEDDR